MVIVEENNTLFEDETIFSLKFYDDMLGWVYLPEEVVDVLFDIWYERFDYNDETADIYN